MLAPAMYQQLGLRPQYSEQGVLTGFAEDPMFAQQRQLEQQLGMQQLQYQQEFMPLQGELTRMQLGQMRELGPLQTQLARQQIQQQQELVPLQMETMREQLAMGRESFAFEKQMAMRQMGYTEAQINRQAAIDAEVRAQQAEQQRMERLTAPFAYEQMGLKAQVDPATGKVVGLTKIVDPLAEQRRAIEGQYLERTQKALRGELPVDPALHRELAEQEATRREALRQQLGPGYETSTPGVEALARYGQAKAEALSAASRGELTLSEQLGMARQAGGLQEAQFARGGITDVGGYLAGIAAQPRGELISLSGRGVGGGGAAAPGGQAFAQAARMAQGMGGGVQLPGGGGIQMPSFGGGGGAFPSGQQRLQQLMALSGGQADFGQIMQGIGGLQGTLGQWRGQQYQTKIAEAQAQQAQQQMYAGMGAAGLSAAALVAGAVPSSRRYKTEVRALHAAQEKRLRDELAGD
jgi:hypothetical protein